MRTSDNSLGWTRRHVLRAMGYAGSLALVPRVSFAQENGSVMLGSLLPLSGSGGAIGPSIRAAQQGVIDEANRAGGVLGRKIVLVGEDDQTNPEAGVRAVTKLINVDHICALMGGWSSGVAMAVAPLCWENKVMFFCIGAADSITQLPHQGYIVRTQPSTALQSEQFARFAIDRGVKSFFIMMPQTPFTGSTIDIVSKACQEKGVKVSSLIYDAQKTSFRSEVQAMMKSAPDMVMAGGYLPDTIVLAKDLYRADYRGKIVSYAYSLSPQFISAVGAQVAENMYSIEPVGDAGSGAYTRLQKMLGKQDMDIYTCHGYDEASLAILSIAQAGQATGTAIRGAVRKIGDPSGVSVDNVVDGLAALAKGQRINYLGASGVCKFKPNGDVISAKFRINVVHDGKIVPFKII